MKKYKVMIDYNNFIPIQEDELEKAIKAWMANGKALFNAGATSRIEAVLPDEHAMMGWNYGYKLLPEDYSEIARSKDCQDARRTIEQKKNELLGISKEQPKEISDGVKQLADKMSIGDYKRG